MAVEEVEIWKYRTTMCVDLEEDSGLVDQFVPGA